MKLTKHFDSSEFDCHDGQPLPLVYVPNAKLWCEMLGEPIRAQIARPVSIISGWRSIEHNTRVGGAKKSTHLTADGADIRSGNVDELFDVILWLYENDKIPGLGGLGRYRGWIHVDTNRLRDGRLRQWHGRGLGSEETGPE